MKLTEIRYHVAEPGSLSAMQQVGINALITRATQTAYPAQGSRQIARHVDRERARRRDPNSLNLTQHRRQRFAHPIGVLAHHEGSLVGYLSVADSASSRWSGVAGKVERHAKLRLPQLAAHRSVWLGRAALTPEIEREVLQRPADEANQLDVMIALGLASRSRRQPITTRTWKPDTAMARELSALGFSPQPEQEVHAFGASDMPACERPWSGPSVDEVEDHLFAKRGFGDAWDQAQRTLMSR